MASGQGVAGDLENGDERRARRDPACVYFIQAKNSGLIKIGTATCPLTRMKTLQTGSPDELVLIGVIPVLCSNWDKHPGGGER